MNKKQDVETLLNILNMGGCHDSKTSERNWLVQVLYAIPKNSANKDFANKWLAVIKEKWASESEYFTIRNDIRTEALSLVNILAAEELAKLNKRKRAVTIELDYINKRLARFNSWK